MIEPKIRTKLIEIFMKTSPITKEEFCKKCKITSKAFDKIMQNDLSISIRTLARVANAMHLNLYQMFEKPNTLTD